MTSTHQLISNVIDSGNALRANRLRVSGKFLKTTFTALIHVFRQFRQVRYLEAFPQECHVIVVLSQFVRTGNDLAIGDPLAQIINFAAQRKSM